MLLKMLESALQSLRARRLAADEDGQGLMEYVLIVGLVSVVLIGGLTAFALALDTKYGTIVPGLG